MLVNNTRRNLNANLLRLDEFQRQISTGRTISRPSDNPAGTVKSLRLRTSLMEGDQYLSNINEAVSFMETTDASLHNIDEIMQTIREKTVKGATTNDPDAFSAIAKEINELKDQLKIIANATYGSKYIFAGTNVTEVPYNNGLWTGNEDSLDVEIGVGVKASINIPQMKGFFMGRMDYSRKLDPLTGISSLNGQNLKEGEYELRTRVGAAGDFASSTIRESQSYLSAVPNNKCFFYEDIQHAATLGVGATVGTTDASYSGSLAIEVKSVDKAPHFFLKDGSNANQCVMEVDQALFRKNASGTVVPLVNGEDISAMFNLTALPGWSATYNDNGQGVVTVTFSGPQPPAAPAPPADDGDTFVLTDHLYNAEGAEYVPRTATFNDPPGTWEYHGVSTVTANVKGHIYDTDGTQHDIDLANVTLNVEAGGTGAAANREIFRISGADINPAAPGPDLVVWNAGANALGGIDCRTPALKAGDKTILTIGAAVAAAGAEQIKMDYSFTDIDGKQVGNGGFSYVFNAGTMDNKTKDLQFFTMDQQTGVMQDATMTFKTNTLGTVPNPPATPPATDLPAAKFDYQAGIFGYIDELVGTIQAGKLPQVGNLLKGNDIRLQELLYHRSTIGARVNRMELQESRLRSSEESLTELLSKNEDTDEAKVLMQLKQQENVYQASLAVGARIIQPTLVDFLK